MRSLFAALLVPAAAFAQLSGSCANPFQFDFQPDKELRIRVRSGDIAVVGTDAPRVQVTCESKGNPADIAVSIKPRARYSELRIKNGPTNARIRIEIPRKTHLWLRSPAGEITV